MRKLKVDSAFISIFLFSVIFFSYEEGMSYITQLLAIPLVVLFLVRSFILKDGFIVPLEFCLVGFWLVFSIVSGIFAVDFNVFFNKFLTCLQVMGIAFVLFNLLVWLKSSTLVWSNIFFSTLIMSVFVLQYPTRYYIHDRLAGRLENANLYALALVIAYVYALNRIIGSRSVAMKLFCLSSIPFILYLIGEAGSRKGIIAVVCFGILTMILHYRYIFEKPIIVRLSIAVALIVLVVISSYYIYQSKHIQRLEGVYIALKSGNISKADQSFKHRLQLYDYGWKMAVKHPVLGMGLNNFRVVLAKNSNSSKGVYSHSNMIELLASTGFIGFAIYYSIYGSIFVKLIKLRRKYWKLWEDENKELYITTFALFIIFGLYDFAMVSYQGKLSWIILSSIIASTAILAEQNP